MGFRDVRRRQYPLELADDLTNNTLADKELLAQYKRIEQLSNEDKYLIKRFINSFLLSAEILALVQVHTDGVQMKKHLQHASFNLGSDHKNILNGTPPFLRL